ncbi:hypothetical protein QEG73_05215 [Chitinophagaceae bacterium 26-R-25]|nr:hypothetical protein [Chitinophagaceae bacterium 26-R-25]
MAEPTFIEKLVTSEIAGKNAAIHAYDGMIWKVRSGFLTLIFAGWSLIIKTAIENNSDIIVILPYVFILSAFSLALAIGGYKIDKNYIKRKFRIINGLNELTQLAATIDINAKNERQNEMIEHLKILGDAANDKYKSKAYENELLVSKIIYVTPSILILGMIIYYQIKFIER